MIRFEYRGVMRCDKDSVAGARLSFPIFSSLSPARREIASLYARGLKDVEITGVLGIPLAKIRAHVNALQERFGVQSRVELIQCLVGGLGRPA